MEGALSGVAGMGGSWVRHFSRSLASFTHTDMSFLSFGEHLTLGASLSGEFVGDLVRLVSWVVVRGISVMPGSGVGIVSVVWWVCVDAA